MTQPHKNRIKKIQSLLKTNASSALLLSSAPEVIRTRDDYYPYRQNSDFFYVTGSLDKDLSILVTSEKSLPFLIARKVDQTKVVWDGAPRDPKILAKALGAELIVTENPSHEIREKLKGITHLFHQNHPGTLSAILAAQLQATPSHQRGKMPITFSHSDALIEELRLYKDSVEVAAIREAGAITARAIETAVEKMEAGIPEFLVARTIEFWFGLCGATPGFGTIVATGPSAATLHHRAGERKLKKGELVLIDCGAEFNMYNGDITRVYPVDGKFTAPQQTLYEAVLGAQKAAIKKIKHGVLIEDVYNAAAQILTEGLVDLKILSGKVSKLVGNKAYKPYFPHGIGHSLGIDVHDVGNHRGNNKATLKAGMVFTVEPGLYFAKKTKLLDSCGVRIEDDVLVTKNGCEVLTKGLEKEIRDLASG